MGADIKNLRNRIKSIDSTLHLTKAMGLVASSKIRRTTDAMCKSREYLSAFDDAFSMLLAGRECEKSPYLNGQNGGKTLIITIAGDRGLAGGYNSNVFKLAKEYPDAEFIGIGKKACDKFGGEYSKVESFKYDDARALSEIVCKDFSDGKYNRIGIIGTKYISMMSQQAEIKWMLPLEKSKNSLKSGIVFEPGEVSVLNAAVREYIAAKIIKCVYESFASEVAARRVAMDSAGKNAQQMIDDLSIKYNRARQGAITQEITEIVAGSGL